MLALVDDKEQVFLQPVELVLHHVRVHLGLGLVQGLAPFRVLKDAQEHLVLRTAHLHLKHLADRERAVLVGEGRLREQILRLSRKAVAQARLVVDQAVNGRLDSGEGLLALDRGGARNDERGARLVHQDGVNFVDDAVPVVALHLVVLAGRHAIVAKVIKPELTRGPVRDIAPVHLAADVRGHLLLDATHADSQEIIEVAHPLRVTSC